MLTTTTDLSVESRQDLVYTPSPQRRDRDGHERGIKEAAFRSVLKKLGRSELRLVHITLVNDTVRLDGDVSTYHAKQLAQEALRPIARGLKIENHLRVVGRR